MSPYQVDYAKSDKSKCKVCKQGIKKNELRVAVKVKIMGLFRPLWNHEKCFFRKGKRLGRTNQFENFNILKYIDQQRIKDQLVDPDLEEKITEPNKMITAKDQAFISQYSIEKSKNSRPTCRACRLKIITDDVKVCRTQYEENKGEIDYHYHLTCFAKIRHNLNFTLGGEHIPGYLLLNEQDKATVNNLIRCNRSVVQLSNKHKLETPNTLDDTMENLIRHQSELFHCFKTALQTLSKADLKILCDKNSLYMFKGTAKILDLLADCMAFGALEHCPECRGQLMLTNFYYECCGFRNVWSSCKYRTIDPKRKLMVVPRELQQYSVLKEYVPSLGVRIFEDVPPTENSHPQNKKIKTALVESVAPLKNVQFYIHGLKGENRERVKRRIVRRGGLVAARVAATVAAAVVAPGALTAPRRHTSVLETIEIACIHVVEEKFLDEIESPECVTVNDAIAVIEANNIADWACDIRCRIPQDVIDEKPVRVSGDMYIFKSQNQNISTKKVKDGIPIVAGTELDTECHVYCEAEGGGAYSAALGRVDLNAAQAHNYSCTLQLLQADRNKRYWVVKSTGETGSTPKVTIKEFEDDLTAAKEFFMKEFFNKTGNLWAFRHQFHKRAGKYDLVQMANLNNIIQEPTMDSQSSLPAPIQNLIVLILNINILNKTIADIEVDTSKMPLGVISDEQIEFGRETLWQLLAYVHKGKVSKNTIRDLSNKFYTKIPHKGSVKNLVLLNEIDLIMAKMEMLNELAHSRITYRLLHEEMDKSVDAMMQNYTRLNTEIVTLDKDSKEYNLISNYFANTQSSAHSMQMDIVEIFKVERQGEAERYKHYSTYSNRMLLWHGSRVSNIAAILIEGLRIAPPVKATGYMFGKGIYFADVVSKSAQYIHATVDHPSGVLLLCEVALGNMRKCYTKEYITELPNDTHSVWGVGRIQPNPGTKYTLDDGTVIPLGNIIFNEEVDQTELIHNEFIVYNEAQVRIKHLVQIKFYW